MQRFIKRRLALLALLPALLPSLPALAQTTGQLYDQIDLMASAEGEIANDLLIAVVYAEVEDSDQAEAADRVNRDIDWAADQARRAGGIELQTAQYNTRPVYANGRRIVGWVARQSLRLESTDAAKLSALLGRLQERVAVQSISYGLSETAREEAENALIADSLAKFRARADLVASELGRDGFRIVRLNVGTPNMPVSYREIRSFATVAAADSVAPPEIEAGVQTIMVTTSGTIELNAEQ